MCNVVKVITAMPIKLKASCFSTCLWQGKGCQAKSAPANRNKEGFYVYTRPSVCVRTYEYICVHVFVNKCVCCCAHTYTHTHKYIYSVYLSVHICVCYNRSELLCVCVCVSELMVAICVLVRCFWTALRSKGTSYSCCVEFAHEETNISKTNQITFL